MRFILLVCMLGLTTFSTAQTYLQNLHPKPRTAYSRPLSAVFTPPAPGNAIFLDPLRPSFEEASRINGFLRKHNQDTLRVLFATEADSLSPGILLGVSSRLLNDILAHVPDQRIIVTASYPGPEGYVLDALPRGIIINASDAQGLRYGVDAMLQLMSADAPWLSVRACRIVDAPQYPNRWMYQSANLQVAANIPPLRDLWRSAAAARCNGVALADSKFSRITTVPDRYRDTLLSLKTFAEELGLEVIPCVMPMGYSGSILYHDPNLASGLPVRQQRFVAEADSARLLPRADVALSNGGFEARNGDSFPGFLYIDGPGSVSFADTDFFHSGSASVRFEQFTQPHGHGRISYWTRVTPYTQYHVRGWVRTENLQPASSVRMFVLAPGSRTLAFDDFGVPSNSEWTRLDFTFNSLDTDSLGIYWGVWGATGGRIWWDDLAFEETAFVNLLRREGTPLDIRSMDSADLREGRDYDTLRDPLLGNVRWPGDYNSWHQPPTLRFGPTVNTGDTVHASYYHTMLIHGWQVAATLSDEKLYSILDREFSLLDSLWQADTYFMQHDELRVCNWDKGDLDRGMTPAQLLADNVSRCRDIIHRHAPAADIWVWTDMFDEHHNAVQGPYYLVNGDLRGSADLLPKDIGMMNWNGREGIIQHSLQFFEQKGFRQMSAPYYDNDEQHIRRWKEWTQLTENFHGMMYTTWQQQYEHLAHFGEYAWNHAPYVEHLPPSVLRSGSTQAFDINVYGDEADAGWKLSRATLHYRTQPGIEFSNRSFPAGTSPLTQHLDIPPDATWLQWYITAEDNRGWTTRIPLGDTMFYQLGDITSGSAAVSIDGLTLHGVYPNPARGNLHIEWSTNTAHDLSVKLSDILGREILQRQFVPSTGQIQRNDLNLSALHPGIYFIILHSREFLHTQSVMITR